jgi:beta-lactamase regulating signal transducer with metallopeptidase domain
MVRVLDEAGSIRDDNAYFDTVIPWSTVMVGVWAAGSLLWFLLAIVRLTHFGILLRYAEPASENLRAETRRIAATYNLRNLPRVLLVAAKVPPLIWSFGNRNCMVLPIGLLSQLEADQRSGLLAHELAHLKRRDHWVRWLEFVVLGIYWWNPVAWWARGQIQRAEEECCDRWVLWAFPDMGHQYAQALLETVDFLADSPSAKPAIATAFCQGNSLKRRIEMIVSNRISQQLTWKTRTVLMLCSLLVVPLLFVGATIAQTVNETNVQASDAEPPREQETGGASGKQSAEGLTANYHCDFRDGHFDRDHLLPVGSLSTYSWTLLKPEPRGLRITIPWHQGKEKPTLGIAPTLKIHGDFQITATYELVAADTPEVFLPVGGQIYVMAEKTLNGASILRGVMPEGKQVYCLYWALRDETGRKSRSEIALAETRRGRLRFVRTGESLLFLVAEDDDEEFKELKKVKFGREPIGLFRAESITNGTPCTAETLWSDIDISAEKLEAIEIPLRDTSDVGTP